MDQGDRPCSMPFDEQMRGWMDFSIPPSASGGRLHDPKGVFSHEDMRTMPAEAIRLLRVDWSPQLDRVLSRPADVHAGDVGWFCCLCGAVAWVADPNGLFAS